MVKAPTFNEKWKDYNHLDWYANSDSWNICFSSHIFLFFLSYKEIQIFANLTAEFSTMQSFSEVNNHFLQFSDTEKLATEHLLPKKEVCGECSLIVRVFNLPYKEYLNSLLEKCLLYSISTYFILFQVSSSWLSKTVLKCQKPLFPILREYLILHSVKYSWGSI